MATVTYPQAPDTVPQALQKLRAAMKAHAESLRRTSDELKIHGAKLDSQAKADQAQLLIDYCQMLNRLETDYQKQSDEHAAHILKTRLEADAMRAALYPRNTMFANAEMRMSSPTQSNP